MLSEPVVFQEIALDLINPNNFRLRPIDESIIVSLMKSIEKKGLLQPIMVRPQKEGKYEVIFGLHRVEAVKRLGIKKIKGIIRNVDDEEAFLLAINENIHRNVFLNPLEEAKGYLTLIKKGWTMTRIADSIGKSDNYVSDRIKLIKRLNPEVAKMIGPPGSTITTSHAELLTQIDDKDEQFEFAEIIGRKRLSVHKLESILYERKRMKKEKMDMSLIELNRGMLYSLNERVSLISEKSYNMLINNFRGDIRSLASEMGGFAHARHKTYSNPKIDLWNKKVNMIKHWNRRTGLGEIQFLGKSITVNYPIIKNKIWWKYYLESFLKVKLKRLKSTPSKFSFGILENY